MTNRMKSAIYVEDNKVEMDYPQFNGGERNIRISKEWVVAGDDCMISALLFDSNSIMDLLLVCDAVKRLGAEDIFLFLPYVPYGRQDRVCNEGESHSLKVFAGLINSIGAREVVTLDPHSDVTEALIDNLTVVSQHEILEQGGKLLKGLSTNTNNVIIAPDGGAIKKAFKVARSFETQFETAEKFRNVSTGEIEKVIFKPNESIDGKHCWVVDDLADAGGSFIHLGKEIRKFHQPLSLNLYVTHGLFVKGVKELYNVYDNVYTCDYADLYTEAEEALPVIRLENE